MEERGEGGRVLDVEWEKGRGERREERVGGRGEGNTPESLGSARYASQRGGRQETCSWS